MFSSGEAACGPSGILCGEVRNTGRREAWSGNQLAATAVQASHRWESDHSRDQNQVAAIFAARRELWPSHQS